MQKVKNIKWLPVLMTLTIIAIAAFQIYWLNKAYEREQRTLEMRSNFLFRETVFSLQGSKLKLDRINVDSSSTRGRLLVKENFSKPPVRIKVSADQKVVNMVDVLVRKVRDSDQKTFII